MKLYITFVLSTVIYFIGLPSLLAQSEEILKKEFTNKLAISHIEMPADKMGFSVYPHQDQPIDVKEYGKKLKKHGFSVYAGDTIVINKIKVKRKHIEVHLTNFDPNRKSSKTYTVKKRMLKQGVMTKSEYERLLRSQQMNTDKQRALKSMKYYNGSRIAIRLDRKVTPDDLTVDALTMYLSDYVTLIDIQN